MVIFINKDNLVKSQYITDAKTPIEITEKQFMTISFTPMYKAWKYDTQADSFSLVDILSDDIIRIRRQTECFNIIDNRSIFWWESLTESQKTELKNWYNDWLDATSTKKIPLKPKWLK